MRQPAARKNRTAKRKRRESRSHPRS